MCPAVRSAAEASSPELTASRNRLTTSLFSLPVMAGHSAAVGVASCAAERAGPRSASEPRSVATRMRTDNADRCINHLSYGNKAMLAGAELHSPRRHHIFILSPYHRPAVRIAAQRSDSSAPNSGRPSFRATPCEAALSHDVL